MTHGLARYSVVPTINSRAADGPSAGRTLSTMIEGRPIAQEVNLYGTVHGGAIMKVVDNAAGAVLPRAA